MYRVRVYLYKNVPARVNDATQRARDSEMTNGASAPSASRRGCLPWRVVDARRALVVITILSMFLFIVYRLRRLTCAVLKLLPNAAVFAIVNSAVHYAVHFHLNIYITYATLPAVWGIHINCLSAKFDFGNKPESDLPFCMFRRWRIAQHGILVKMSMRKIRSGTSQTKKLLLTCSAYALIHFISQQICTLT